MAEQNQTCELRNPSWTLFERQLKLFQSSQCEDVDLYEAIKQRMQDSSLRSFLHHLNPTQLQQTFIQQDKLERMQFDIGKDLVNVKELERFDDICEDLFGLIDLYLKTSSTGIMTVKKVLKSMNALRLTGSKITNMDDTLRRLRDLEALVLAGNCISSVPGGSLPRGLMVLELCCNRLDDICSLADNPPPHLLYLGLARNNLTTGVLEALDQFKFLYHLDLAQNDIEDLSAVVVACSLLHHLSSLLLIGNPCSLTPNYSTFILKKIPKLIFLDGEMLKKQECSEKDDMELEQYLLGTLQVHLFRVMGLQQPSNQKINKKKVSHSFRLEMECPLLEPYLLKREKSFIIDESLVQNEEDMIKSDKQDVKKKKDDKDGMTKQQKKKRSGDLKNKEKKKSSDVSSKKGKKSSDSVNNKERKKSSKELNSTKGKKLSKEIKNKENPEEPDSKEKQEAEMYELELKSDQSYPQECFKSERKNWGKIVEFNEPAIEVPDCDLLPLRDIFRTDLALRVVHLKTLPPVSKVKSKPKKQGKNNTSEENTSGGEDVNKEILVSKSTLAKIKVPLQDILWSKKYLEFAWTIAKPFAVEPTSDLKNLQYIVKKKKEPKGKKGEAKSGEVPLPSVLTCHIGIGVKREEPDGEECVLD